MTNADDSVAWLPATEMARAIDRGNLSITEVAEYFIGRIERLNPQLNAYVVFDPDQIRVDARRLQEVKDGGAETGPMFGVPYSVKEANAVAGLPCTGGMKPWAAVTADHDDTLVTRLKEAGGLFLGKTNMPENGYWCGTDGHLYGATRNPWRLDSSPSGSSGGAGAAVAAGLGPLSLGSDGAGSVRSPASACGIVGLKSTLGRLPQEFLPSRHETWIAHGPMTRTVRDAALMMDVMSGPSAADPLSLPLDGTRYLADLDVDITGWRIAWSPDLGLGDAYTDPEVVAVCERAVAAFEELGATVVEARPNWANLEETMWNSIWLPVYGMDVDAFDWGALHGDVDEQLIEIVEQAGRLSAVDRARADLQRGAIYRAFADFMRDHDLLVSPTLATTPLPIGQFTPDHLRDAPLRHQLLGWLLTYPFNLTATPSISVPAGFSSGGLPIGLQLSGRHHEDLRVLQGAAAFERARPWAGTIPDMARESAT